MVCLWCFKGKASDVNRTQERVRSEISFSFKKDVVGAFRHKYLYFSDVIIDRLVAWSKVWVRGTVNGKVSVGQC